MGIVNGHHDTQVFQDLIDKFIDKFVLCQGCQLPEIDMVVKKGQVVATCKACGWSGALDNDHRLASYIVKHPPDTGIGFDDENKKKTKAERQAARNSKRASDAAEEAKDEEAVGDDAKDKKEKKEKKENDKSEKKEKKEEEESKEEGSDDDDEVKEKEEKKEKKDKKDKRDK